ncbi:MAG TPA: hypothetical protein DEB57_11810, partial [Microbacterium sp.]|nr:hypothetical protein [Microbacterium sp.]
MEKPTQLPSGQWRQRYTGPDGKRHSTTDTSARKVQKKAALELAAMIEKAFAKEPEKTETRFDLFAEQHLQTRRPGEPGGYAVSVYPKRLNHLRTLNRTFGAHNVEDITPAQIRAWWNSLSATPAQRHTLYWFMHQIFEIALDDELIQRNPCRVKKAHENGSKGRPTFEDDAVEKIYKATEEKQMRAAVAVLRGTALRVGELVALDWEDLDFLEHTIPVTKHWTPWGIQPGTKTGPEHARTIAMPAWVQDVLEDLFRGSDGEGPIFR